MVDDAEDIWRLHFRLAPQVVLGILRDNIGYVFRQFVSEVLRSPLKGIFIHLIGRDCIGIPSVSHYEIYGQLFRFQVTYINNPQVIDTCLISQIELFTQFRSRRSVYPTVIARPAVHVDMVIKPHSSLAVFLFQGTTATDIAPVVVAEKEKDIIRYGETLIVIALHLGKDSPKLRHL